MISVEVRLWKWASGDNYFLKFIHSVFGLKPLHVHSVRWQSPWQKNKKHFLANISCRLWLRLKRSLLHQVHVVVALEMWPHLRSRQEVLIFRSKLLRWHVKPSGSFQYYHVRYNVLLKHQKLTCWAVKGICRVTLGAKRKVYFSAGTGNKARLDGKKNNAAVAYKRGEEKQSSWLHDSIIFTTQQKN